MAEDRVLYLVSRGAYSDFRVEYIIDGPPGLPMKALRAQFHAVFSGYESVRYDDADFTFEKRILDVERADAERRREPWYVACADEGPYNFDACFGRWLQLHHDAFIRPYEDVWLDD